MFYSNKENQPGQNHLDTREAGTRQAVKKNDFQHFIQTRVNLTKYKECITSSSFKSHLVQSRLSKNNSQEEELEEKKNF